MTGRRLDGTIVQVRGGGWVVTIQFAGLAGIIGILILGVRLFDTVQRNDKTLVEVQTKQLDQDRRLIRIEAKIDPGAPLVGAGATR